MADPGPRRPPPPRPPPAPSPQASTLQASYLDKAVRGSDLSIWDTAGQERFHALGPIYYRDADGALLVYDITDAESFSRVQRWVQELRRTVGDDIAVAIAGNKADLERQRAVAAEEAEAYAQRVGATHFLTSAKADRGIGAVFEDLAARMRERRAALDAGPGGRRGSGRLVILDDAEEEPPASGCC